MEIGQIRGWEIPVGLQNLRRQAPRSFCVSVSVTPKSEKRMFILGMGFVGHSLARKLHNLGWSHILFPINDNTINFSFRLHFLLQSFKLFLIDRAVTGTCTTPVKKKQLQDWGFHVHLFDANQPERTILDLMRNYTHLLVSVPPVVGLGDPMLQHEELLRSSLVNGDLQWLCYLSSTSVYGDCGGKLVDEDYPTNPEGDLAKLRLASEEGWSNLAHYLGFSPHIFRLGGIYGPGRSAIDTIIKRETLSEGQKMRKYRKYTSRIHVEDICQALMATIYAPSPREVYNIVDDDPAPREEVFEYARKLVEQKWPGLNLQPPEQKKQCSVVKTRNIRGEKRVSNARIKNELGVQLLHPDYRSGLRSIIDQMESPFRCD